MLLLWGVLLQISSNIPSQSVLTSSSEQAEEINHVTNYFFIAAAFILLTVVASTIYVLYKFRDKKNVNAKPLSRKWEIAMIGVPSLLVALFLYFNIRTISSVEPSVHDQTPDVIITAHQWWWEANYPSANVTTANEIYLPAGKKLLLKLLAADVIHDWWVPQFGNKMDMVPTQENYLWITIKQPGEFYGTCSEFCGAQHAHMRIKVVALLLSDYESWLQQHNQPAVSTSLNSGQQLFLTKTCGNCHRIAGTNANGTVGPDLTHIASRQTLLAGLMDNNEQNIENWIRHPQQIKPGAYMPDFHLDDTTVKAIAAYLYSLK